MSKVALFWPYPPKFFSRPFFRHPQKIFRLPKFFNLFRPKRSFFRLYRPKKCFLALKNLFFRPKNFLKLFRPKNSFLDFLDLKISLNPLQTLRKHLFSLQIDEKNNISFLDFIAKNCRSYYNCTFPGPLSFCFTLLS